MTTGDRLPLAGLWGNIQAAVRERVSTAELWATVNAAAAERGFSGTSGGIQEMNRLRALAGGLRNAAENFARASLDQQIDTTMFAPDINAQSIIGRSITPTYRVRYEQTTISPTGEQVSTWRTSSFPVQLPSTKELLMAEIDADAASLAETYGEQHVGIGSLEISVV